MQTTTNYGLKIYEGTDLFNPLTVENVNTSDLDSIVKGVSDAAVGTATELLTGTVHALTRADSDRNVFHFTATANFEAGETFEVDGVQVTAKTPDGQNLSTGAYVINSSVLCILVGTLLTVMVNPAKALDSDKLDGHDSTYFATAGDLSVLDNQVGAVSSKVGTGVLDVGNDCVDGINTLNTTLTQKEDKTTILATATADGVKNYGQLLNELFTQLDLDDVTFKSKLVLYVSGAYTIADLSVKTATYVSYCNTTATASGARVTTYTVATSSNINQATGTTASSSGTSTVVPTGSVFTIYDK